MKFGTITTRLSKEGRKRVSVGVYKFYIDKKLERFSDVIIPDCVPLDKLVRPLKREGKHFGWYVFYKGNKADFGGIHIPLEIARHRAEEFVNIIKEQSKAKLLEDRETPKALATI